MFVVRQSKVFLPIYHRAGITASLHTTRTLLATPTKESDTSAFEKIAHGLNSFKSTVLGSPPLRNITKPVDTPFTGEAANWNQALSEAQSLVKDSENRIIDPAKLVGDDLKKSKPTSLNY